MLASVETKLTGIGGCGEARHRHGPVQTRGDDEAAAE